MSPSAQDINLDNGLHLARTSGNRVVVTRKRSLDSSMNGFSTFQSIDHLTTDYLHTEEQDSKKLAIRSGSVRGSRLLINYTSTPTTASRSEASVRRKDSVSEKLAKRSSTLGTAIEASPEFMRRPVEVQCDTSRCAAKERNTSAADNKHSSMTTQGPTRTDADGSIAEDVETVTSGSQTSLVDCTRVEEDLSLARTMKRHGGPKMSDKFTSSSSGKSMTKRRRCKSSSSIATIESPQSSMPSISSSAAFQANLMDIEQYVEEDLQGFNRLSY